jgi:hypothetical protein
MFYTPSTADYQWSACEGGTQGMLKWPSLGGTHDELVAAIEGLQGRGTGQLLTVGLIANFDESVVESIECCKYRGDITGLLHFHGNSLLAGSTQHSRPPDQGELIWEQIVKIDKEGRKKGVYNLSYPETWLIILSGEDQ